MKKETERAMAWNWKNGPRSKAAFTACFLAPCLIASAPAKAQVVCPPPPVQTITIYNDTPDQYLFAEFEVGLSDNDVWLQAWCKVPNSQIGKYPYPTTLTNRIYINPTTGIAPNHSVVITLPLYTQLAQPVVATENNQFAEWWQGQNIQLFYSPTSRPPRAFTEYYTRLLRKNQQQMTSAAAAPTWPTCSSTRDNPCSLEFVTDTEGTFPKYGPSQLLEATLGARQEQKVVNDSPPNRLDIRNADFDVSYVNVAYGPAAMGPKNNDQVGYVGTPMQLTGNPGGFRSIGNQFWKDQNAKFGADAWPRFVFTYADGASEIIPKLPSPLEVFARLSGANPPADLEPAPHWPDRLWPAIQNLKDQGANWAHACTHSPQGNTTFCDALLDVVALLQANYQNYLTLFKTGVCTGTPLGQTVNGVLSHIYGWTPWIEDAAGRKGYGCKPADNLLENTPGYWSWSDPNDHKKPKDYSKYLAVKLEFDKLNYGTLPEEKYTFNPWVQFIHGKNYLNIPGAYAYSVDDAVGNIQAEATGYIVDVGSVNHLENKYPAEQPINVSLGYDPEAAIKFASYRVCVNDAAHDKPVNELNPAFIMNARDPLTCPVFLIDNKNPAQTYTFTITQSPPFAQFTIPQVNAGVPRWDNSMTGDVPPVPTKTNTTYYVQCDGNAPFAQSSKSWCCNKTSSTGVWAYTMPDAASAHKTSVYTVVTNPALTNATTTDTACTLGH
jgi:hypothetical protein